MQELHRRGILFCPASDQLDITSLRKLFCTGGGLLCFSAKTAA